MLPKFTPDQVARFWSKLSAPDANGCRHWTGPRALNGYGRFLANMRRHLAHRIAYQLTNGELPDWLHVCHLCDQRSCCEPTHLVAADHAWNMADRNRKGRTARGDRNGSRAKSGRLRRGADHPAKLHNGAYFRRGDQHPARTDPSYLLRGSAHQNARLTEAVVLEARARYAAGGTTLKTLARWAGVSITSMHRIVHRKAWAHV